MTKFLCHKLLIAVKSGNLENFITAYRFTDAAVNHPKIQIKTVFFYQEGINILLNSDVSQKWIQLINNHNILATVCNSAYKKRGIIIKHPFQASSMLTFINDCEISDRIIQF